MSRCKLTVCTQTSTTLAVTNEILMFYTCKLNQQCTCACLWLCVRLCHCLFVSVCVCRRSDRVFWRAVRRQSSSIPRPWQIQQFSCPSFWYVKTRSIASDLSFLRWTLHACLTNLGFLYSFDSSFYRTCVVTLQPYDYTPCAWKNRLHVLYNTDKL